MNFETFRKGVLATFGEYMEDIGATGVIRENIVNKVNIKKHGLVFLFDTVDGVSYEDCEVFPTVYLEDMYKVYCDSEDGDLDAILKDYASLLKASFVGKASSYSLDLSDVANNVFAQFVNTKRNKSLLAKVPNRKWNDLSIVYRVNTESEQLGRGSMLVTNALAKQYGLTEEQLYEHSVKNMPRLLPIEVMDLAEMFGESDMETGLVKISNIYNLYGAAAIMDKNVLKELSEKMGGDLYLLPSSIHEFLAVVADEFMLEMLSNLVNDCNQNLLNEDEYLSDQVYLYKQKTGEITCLLKKTATITIEV